MLIENIRASELKVDENLVPYKEITFRLNIEALADMLVLQRNDVEKLLKEQLINKLYKD